jgi:hypothetical protein
MGARGGPAGIGRSPEALGAGNSLNVARRVAILEIARPAAYLAGPANHHLAQWIKSWATLGIGTRRQRHPLDSPVVLSRPRIIGRINPCLPTSPIQGMLSRCLVRSRLPAARSTRGTPELVIASLKALAQFDFR